MHDLLPLPYTEEALKHVVTRVEQVQEILGRRILLENVSSYVTFAHSRMEEWEFITEVVERADCGILLDINNIFVSANNHGSDPLDYLEAIPVERVGQFHLAGHRREGDILIDTHDHPVSEPVWELFESALKKFGRVSTLIEWDADIPAVDAVISAVLEMVPAAESFTLTTRFKVALAPLAKAPTLQTPVSES